MLSKLPRTPVEVVVEQMEGEDLYLVMVATRHHAFSLSRSSTFRSLKDFYFLKRSLAVCCFGDFFTFVSVSRCTIWVTSSWRDIPSKTGHFLFNILNVQ